ncbi:hypothetical protein BCR44DRAFT_1428722 [Catenaria anguillulae PL171]|uniref:Uncharacterized protein n=1 Tax=Catenaria anguillulae PL171 TaxID=765915 RepID=A0A1Y2HVP9_9FUNG|nr:hypothetical protein BCR44DRAFT_1428722 [Catenaria anguillulae PL171]
MMHTTRERQKQESHMCLPAGVVVGRGPIKCHGLILLCRPPSHDGLLFLHNRRRLLLLCLCLVLVRHTDPAILHTNGHLTLLTGLLDIVEEARGLVGCGKRQLGTAHLERAALLWPADLHIDHIELSTRPGKIGHGLLGSGFRAQVTNEHVHTTRAGAGASSGLSGRL